MKIPQKNTQITHCPRMLSSGPRAWGLKQLMMFGFALQMIILGWLFKELGYLFGE